MGRLGVLALVLSGLGSSASWAQSAPPYLIPSLAKGTQWELKAFLRRDPILITVDAVRQFGPLEVRTLSVSGATFPAHSLLVSVNEKGVFLEGYRQNDITYRFPASMPYFRVDVAPGTRWTTPVGTVQLTDSNLRTVSATGEVYTDCYRYVLTYPNGDSIIWVLKPGVGFVRIGEGPSAFTLRRLTRISGDNSAENSRAVDCPRIGLSSIPRGPEITPAIRDQAFAAARQAGISFLKVEASWEEIETEPGVYDFSRVLDEIRLATEADIPVVLTIKTVDTVLLSIPADLRSRPLDDPITLARFDAMLDALGPQLAPVVKWVNLGYEVDFFLSLHPAGIEPFRRLFLAGAKRLRDHRDVSVGIVFQYDNARISDVVFRQLFSLGDHVAINYYGHTEGFLARNPAAPLVDIPVLLSESSGRPVLITELGYATSAVVNGSEEKQAEFLQHAFSAIALEADRFPAVNVWAIRDLPMSFIQNLIARYQIDNSAFVGFLGSLGLQDEFGNPKPAWQIFVDTARRFSVAGACEAPE